MLWYLWFNWLTSEGGIEMLLQEQEFDIPGGKVRQLMPVQSTHTPVPVAPARATNNGRIRGGSDVAIGSMRAREIEEDDRMLRWVTRRNSAATRKPRHKDKRPKIKS